MQGAPANGGRRTYHRPARNFSVANYSINSARRAC